MSLTLRVTYAATDGSMPESVELEWPDIQPAASTVLPLLDRLLRAPAERAAVAESMEDPYRWCARCSHYRINHGALESTANGPCRVCKECPSFVSIPGDGYLLPHGAKRSEILGLCSDGAVRNVGAFHVGTKFAMAGPAAEHLKTGRVSMVNGSWYQKETA